LCCADGETGKLIGRGEDEMKTAAAVKKVTAAAGM
jgi:hypothetical protein